MSFGFDDAGIFYQLPINIYVHWVSFGFDDVGIFYLRPTRTNYYTVTVCLLQHSLFFVLTAEHSGVMCQEKRTVNCKLEEFRDN